MRKRLGVPHQQLRQASEPRLRWLRRLRRLSGIIHLILLGPRPAFAPHSDVLNVTIKAIKKDAGVKGANIWPQQRGAAPLRRGHGAASIMQLSATRLLHFAHQPYQILIAASQAAIFR